MLYKLRSTAKLGNLKKLNFTEKTKNSQHFQLFL